MRCNDTFVNANRFGSGACARSSTVHEHSSFASVFSLHFYINKHNESNKISRKIWKFKNQRRPTHADHFKCQNWRKKKKRTEYDTMNVCRFPRYMYAPLSQTKRRDETKSRHQIKVMHLRITVVKLDLLSNIGKWFGSPILLWLCAVARVLFACHFYSLYELMEI